MNHEDNKSEQRPIERVLVCIITHRRIALLQRLVDRLQNQISSNFSFDVLIVDNDCDSAVESFVNGVQHAGSEYRYSPEPKPGIVSARNHAVSKFLASDHEALIFIDDDEYPVDNFWVLKMVEGASTHRADIVYGPVYSEPVKSADSWAVDVMYPPSNLQDGAVLRTFYTNNLLLRRKVLESVEPAFNPVFAMTGGSDYHFALKCIRRGFIAKHVEAPVMEALPTERTELIWYIKRGFRSGAGYSIAHRLEESPVVAIIRSVFMASARVAHGTVLLIGGVLTASRARLARGIIKVSSAAGTFTGIFGISYEEYRERHQ